MSLTDSAIRAAKPADKTIKLFDGGGLYLEVAPSGGKWWRLKYRFLGKEKRISLGIYPTVGLKDAREKREQAKKLLSQGVDPSVQRQAVKASAVSISDSFESVTREWFDKHLINLAPTYSKKVRALFERQIFPVFGEKPITCVEPTDILSAARHVEQSGAIETSHRLIQVCGQVFRYAIATGRAKYDVSQGLHPALRKTVGKHMAALTDKRRIGQLLRAIDAYGGFYPTVCALKLAPMVFLRPKELVQGEWSEIDLDAAEWRIPARRMKMRNEHIVPLCRQAVAILQGLFTYTGKGKYLFPSPKVGSTKPVSIDGLRVALRAMGFTADEMTTHGFRGMASTLLNELGYNRDWIERQLAHSERDHVRGAYNHADFMPERRRMMQEWADYLEKLRDSTNKES